MNNELSLTNYGHVVHFMWKGDKVNEQVDTAYS
jgi:hypothetical protein